MNQNKRMRSAAVIFLSIFFTFFSACGNHEENHDHGKALQKHDEHLEKEKDHQKNHGNEEHDDDHDEKDEADKHDGHGHDGREDTHSDESPQKAVTKADEKKGIQLLPVAAKTIGLKKLPLKKFRIQGSRAYNLPAHLLIRHELNRSCYLKRGAWFIQKKVRVINEEKGRARVIIPGAGNRDKIVTAGVPLLHLSWLEAFGASGHGHGH